MPTLDNSTHPAVSVWGVLSSPSQRPSPSPSLSLSRLSYLPLSIALPAVLTMKTWLPGQHRWFRALPARSGARTSCFATLPTLCKFLAVCRCESSRLISRVCVGDATLQTQCLTTFTMITLVEHQNNNIRAQLINAPYASAMCGTE